MKDDNFNYWNLTISQVLDLQDGPRKKFFLIKYIRAIDPKGVSGLDLKKLSCAQLVVDGLANHFLDDSIILKPVN